MLRRFGPPALVALLIASTGLAFAVTERLKLQRSPITRTKVTKQFSPTCRCASDKADIFFRLRSKDRVTMDILGSDDEDVRRLLSESSRPAGPLRTIWDGRDELGRVAPEGSYRVRVHLAGARRTIVLPNPIRLDRTPPRITLVGAAPLTISPDSDGRADAVHIRFGLSEKGWGLLYVDGRLAIKARLTTRKIDWGGTIRQRVSLGDHELQLQARDRAGNESVLGEPFKVTVRILELEPERIGVLAGKRFSAEVSTDRRRVHWRFAGRSGLVRGRYLSLTAPVEPGEYWLLLDSGPYKAGARVFVF